eukprot:5821008-Amphidinium_carterae.1
MGGMGIYVVGIVMNLWLWLKSAFGGIGPTFVQGSKYAARATQSYGSGYTPPAPGQDGAGEEEGQPME